MQPAAEQLEVLLEPAIASLGFELVDVQWAQDFGRTVLRVLVDRFDGGLTVADCTQVTRAVSPLLDVDAQIPGRYDLEVSSPGLNRPLRKAKDFERFQGKSVEVRTKGPIDGQKNFKGTLELFDGMTLFLKEDNLLKQVPLVAIDKARVLGELAPRGEKKILNKKHS